MASQYKLTYFNIRARAEPVRIAFAYGGIKYEDKRVNFLEQEKEWIPLQQSGACPFGQLPLLEVEGVTLCQSITILRFVATRCGLIPDTDIGQALADMISTGVYDMECAFIRIFLDSDANRKESAFQKFSSENVPKFCHFLEKILEKKPKDETYFVGNKLSYADIAFFSFFNGYIGKGEPAVPDVVKNHPRLTALYTKVGNEPKIKTWLETRPKTPL